MIEFVTASHDEDVYEQNLKRSLLMQSFPPYVQRNYTNISKAYNDYEQGGSEVYCFLHHDLYLPETFADQLYDQFEILPEYWGVVGVCGVKLINGKRENFGHILDRGKPWAFNTDKLPAEVASLDELLLITRGDYVFDENLPQDFYGADICMQARAQGRKCYVINAYAEHNSSRPFKGEGLRTESYYKSREYFREKWKQYLPICTTTGIIE